MQHIELPEVSTPHQSATARRRRMHLRQAKRRLTRVAFVSAVVFALAVMLAPAPVVPPGVTANPAHAATLRTVAMAPQASLSLAPLWKPAGDVLKRQAATGPSLPFAVDPREVERRESLSRWHRIYTYSTRYRIKADLAGSIYDAAVAAGIEPELAFRLVRVESVFDPGAVSPVGAMGLTQLMLGTAKYFEPDVTREDLLNPDVNLRIGFTYLRTLIREYNGNLKLALLVYNRGPAAVQLAIRMGEDPTNGYESIIMRGYRGRGVLE